MYVYIYYEKLEDTNWIIRNHKHNDQKKNDNKTNNDLHRKLKIEQHVPTKNTVLILIFVWVSFASMLK